MKRLLLLTLASACSYVSHAQFSEFTDNAASNFTLSSDNNNLQIGGRTSFFYEYRVPKPNEPKLDKDGFDIKDLDLDLLGKTSSKFVYELHYSLVDLATAAATLNTANPANPGIKAAYLMYVGWPVHIKLGYDKLPFSQGSIQDVYASSQWSHANLYGGDLFSRRDIGLTLNYTGWKSRINVYGGIYSGMGENYFEYGTDNSGTFEYVGRIEFSFPGKMTYHPIDEENSPIPSFRIAVDGRYENKTQPAGEPTVLSSYPDEMGIYGIRMIDGKRSIYGADAQFKYRGISAQFETDIINMQPSDANDPLFNGTSPSFNHGIIMAGGYVATLNYNWEKIHSVFAVQYEDVNVNDLIVGDQQWLNMSYAYKINSFNSVFKIEYYIPEKEDGNSNPLKYTAQLRVGYQIVF
jgi:hypothetical protein